MPEKYETFPEYQHSTYALFSMGSKAAIEYNLQNFAQKPGKACSATLMWSGDKDKNVPVELYKDSSKDVGKIGFVLNPHEVEVPHAEFYAKNTGGIVPTLELTKEGYETIEGRNMDGIGGTNHAKWDAKLEKFHDSGSLEVFAQNVWRRYYQTPKETQKSGSESDKRYRRYDGKGDMEYNEALCWQKGNRNPIEGIVIDVTESVNDKDVQDALDVIREHPQLKLYFYDRKQQENIVRFCNNQDAREILLQGAAHVNNKLYITTLNPLTKDDHTSDKASEETQKKIMDLNPKKFPSEQAPASFLALNEEVRQTILEGTSIIITEQELYHAKRFLALVAITGGQNCTKDDGSQVSQKDVYLQQGILPNLTSEANVDSIEEKINNILPIITSDNIKKFYARLIEKRPKTFYDHSDIYLLRDNLKGKGCPGDTDLEKYVSYSEMEIGAMLQVSGPTQFINNGDRLNRGIPGDDHETQGRISAIAGARLERDNYKQHMHCMESMHCIKGVLEKAESGHKAAINSGSLYGDFGRIKSVNSEFVEGYKYIWSEFYKGLKDKDNKSSKPVNESVLEQRLYISYKKLFADAVANSSNDRKAYIRVIGLGDGAWSGGHDRYVQMAIGKSVRRVFNELSPEQKAKIAAIEFSQYKHQEYHAAFDTTQTLGNSLDGVDIISSDVAPFAHKLNDIYKDCELCVNFAWDGGSYVGNEYWENKLSASGDPAAACCSSIAISMNPEFNSFLDKLNIVTIQGKVKTLESFDKLEAPLLVESYQAASDIYTSEGVVAIASPIYRKEGDNEESLIFPYRQIIRGDGGCFLNAALVGILNRCVNDQEKWQQFKENVIKNYKFATEIIQKIEQRAINIKDDGTENGLDRAKLNEILQEKGNNNLATQLSKKIITYHHEEWIKKYEIKIAQHRNALSDENIGPSARDNNNEYLESSEKYKQFLTSAQEAGNNDFAQQYEESVLREITIKLFDKTGIQDIYTISKELMSDVNENPILAEDLGLFDNSTIYLSNNEEENHFDICYGSKDPIIQDLNRENDKERSKKEETELSNATLAQLSLINDIYEATKEEKSQSREAAREATIKRKETKTHDTKDDKIVTSTKSNITSTYHTPQTPSPTVEIKSNFKKEDYVTTKEKIFYHTNGHSNGKRKTYKENIIEDEGQRKAGAYHNSNKETHEVLNDILQSVIDAAKSTGINDKEKLIKILIEATKKGTVKGDPQVVEEEVKKFSALFQKNCKNKNIFSAQDCKTGLRTKRFGDVFGGIEGISTAIYIHIIAKDSELSLNKITEQASVLQIDPNPLART